MKLLLFLILILIASVRAATITVPIGTLDSVNDAISSANPGDTIVLAAGDWNVVCGSGITLNKMITVTGESAEGRAIITCTNGGIVFFTTTGCTDGTVVRSVTINGAATAIQHSGECNFEARDVIMNHCTNRAINMPPAYSGYSNITLVGCKFFNNSVTTESYSTGSMSGAALLVVQGSTFGTNIPSKIIVIDCVFENNNATRNGGALYFFGSRMLQVDIYNVTFRDNHADSYRYSGYGGGAIMVARDSTLNEAPSVVINHSLFDGNGGASGGSILVETGAVVSISHSVFVSNRANPFNGGAVMTYGDVELVNCTMRLNRAQYDGGAIAGNTIYAHIAVNDSDISYNTAGHNGGAILAYTGSSYDIYRTQLSHNRASSAGAIQLEDAQTSSYMLKMIDCHLSNNSATYGGTIDADNTYQTLVVQMTSTEIRNGNASVCGGFYINGQGSGRINVTMTNCSVRNCTAGGVLVSYASSLLLHGSDVRGNTVYGVSNNGVTSAMNGTVICGNDKQVLGSGTFSVDDTSQTSDLCGDEPEPEPEPEPGSSSHLAIGVTLLMLTVMFIM